MLLNLFLQITQQMQIPLSYADAVIGTSGASISYIRRASGATVTIQETRGNPTEMTVEISGSASQVQTAQQLIQAILLPCPSFICYDSVPIILCILSSRVLIFLSRLLQNFMADAAGAAQTQAAGSTDQGYNSYAAHGSVYASPPSNAGHAGHAGGYGSLYGANYGY